MGVIAANDIAFGLSLARIHALNGWDYSRVQRIADAVRAIKEHKRRHPVSPHRALLPINSGASTTSHRPPS